MASDHNSEQVQRWMEDVAKQKVPQTKLIFDRETKSLISVPIGDQKNGDKVLEFTPQEATRFASIRSTLHLPGTTS